MSIRNLILTGSGIALSLSLSGTAFADAVVLKATLDGASETKGGDADGSGSFSAEIDTETGDVCYTLAVAKIAAVAAAHIHSGEAGKDGKPVTAVDVTGPSDDLCIALEPTVLEEIVAAPWKYYINVHTGDFPAGAIRGQLVGEDGATGPDPAAEAAEAAADAAAEGAGEDGSSGDGDDSGGSDEAPAE